MIPFPTGPLPVKSKICRVIPWSLSGKLGATVQSLPKPTTWCPCSDACARRFFLWGSLQDLHKRPGVNMKHLMAVRENVIESLSVGLRINRPTVWVFEPCTVRRCSMQVSAKGFWHPRTTFDSPPASVLSVKTGMLLISISICWTSCRLS